MATKRRLKNLSVSVQPRTDRTSPVRPLVDTVTRIGATVVVLPIPGKKQFVASTLEDLTILVSGQTRKVTERAALDAYVVKHTASRNPSEDEEDIRDYKARRNQKEFSLASVKRKLGL